MPYIAILASLFGADSAVKAYAEKHYKEGEETPKLGGKVILKKSHNKGAMLNLGSGQPHLTAMLSLVFSAFMTGIFAATLGWKGKKLLSTGLALILGGAYSNTCDRLRKNYVVDYLSFHPGKGKLADKFSSIVFNLADFGIMIGALLLVLGELTEKEK